ncbi:MAG TPA: serine/threonine-protein kinase [Gemmatales bacterium]|nr:serine/threonine-protein kinase [Gemmatales bacterium]
MRPESIFDAAIQKITPTERAAYLDKACGSDLKLRQEIEALLQAHEGRGEFMDKPAVEQTAAFTPEASTAGFSHKPLEHIGAYKLREKLGEGGMGTVYVADQKEPVQRRVAIKLIKEGSDSKALLARFEQERQALALMDHPNIAKIFDAGIFLPSPGTPGEGPGVRGIPYFVMELIKGVPITRYCDEAKLSPKERLELFVPVCKAVQHAHQKGIIHRDLKPSNILIGLYDEKPIPKIIDFGIAKATGSRITDQSIYTEIGSLVGTLEYMSPEQAKLNNIDIDTRSDIYALGVILYELLTGSVPFSRKELEKAGLGEMLRVIKEVEPTKPSTKVSGSGTLPNIAANRQTEPAKLSKMMKGDLDWIVMKSLEKDRNRRYETANQFAQDIDFYLTDKPVYACPPSAMYRMKKWIKRNQTTVAVAAAVFITVIGGVISTEIQHSRTQQETSEKLAALEKLEQEQQKTKAALVEAKANELEAFRKSEMALAVQEFLEKDLIAQVNVFKQGETGRKPDPNLTLKNALDQASLVIPKRFADQPMIEASVRAAIANAYESLGLCVEALPHLERSHDLHQRYVRQHKADSTNDSFLFDYFMAATRLAQLQSNMGMDTKARAIMSSAVEEISKTANGDATRQETIRRLTVLGQPHSKEEVEKEIERIGNDAKNAFAAVDRAITQGLTNDKPGVSTPDKKADTSRNNKGLEQIMEVFKLILAEKFAQAEPILKELLEKSAKAGTVTEDIQSFNLMCMLGEVYRRQSKNDDARQILEKASAGLKKSIGTEHPVIGVCKLSLGHVLYTEKKFDRAEIELRDALSIFEKQTPNHFYLYETKSLLGATLTRIHPIEAESLLKAGYQGLKSQVSTLPGHEKHRMSEALDRLIQFYTDTNKPDEVKKWQAEKDKLAEQLKKAVPPKP